MSWRVEKGSVFIMRVFIFGIISILALSICPLDAYAVKSEKTLWRLKPQPSNYLNYFGKRIVDVSRSRAPELIPQEFGWQGNQIVLIFRMTSRQLTPPELEFHFKVINKDYGVDEFVKVNVLAGTNINNLKPVVEGITLDKMGTYKVRIPSNRFYLGSQNFIQIDGANVHPIGYGNNPPNCRFEAFKLTIPTSETLKVNEIQISEKVSFEYATVEELDAYGIQVTDEYRIEENILPLRMGSDSEEPMQSTAELKKALEQQDVEQLTEAISETLAEVELAPQEPVEVDLDEEVAPEQIEEVIDGEESGDEVEKQFNRLTKEEFQYSDYIE